VTSRLRLWLVLPLLAAQAAEPAFDYADALQKALCFYECQRSGKLPQDNRVQWRGDSCLADGQDAGVDLAGGWYDAGGHLKRNSTMAFAAAVLAWSAVDYREAYVKTGQMPYLLGSLRWVNDYFLKCFVNDQPGACELYVEVGAAGQDRAFWAPAEVVHELTPRRPAYRNDTQCPGADVAASMAAALAASAIVFRENGDPTYAAFLLSKARKLFRFADEHRGAGQKRDAAGNLLGRPNQQFYDELLWAAAWLGRAELAGNPGAVNACLKKAGELFDSDGFKPQRSRPAIVFAPGSVAQGALLLLAQITKQSKGTVVAGILPAVAGGILPPGQNQQPQKDRDEARNLLAPWTTQPSGAMGATPGGLSFHDPDKSSLALRSPLHAACNAAFLAFVLADALEEPEMKKTCHDFAVRQINYALGANPARRSYVIGFGDHSPTAVYHRTAHGPWAGWEHLTQGKPEYRLAARHVLFGALLGGPDKNDSFPEGTLDAARAEPSLDGNAGFTGCLAKMVLESGQTNPPPPGFPPAEKPADEFFVEAGLAAAGAGFVELAAWLNNRSAWPARVSDQLAFRYFFTLEPGLMMESVSATVESDPGAIVTWFTRRHSGSVFYVQVDFTGTSIFPGGLDPKHANRSFYRRRVRLRLTCNGPWDPGNDWSFAGLPPPGQPPAKTARIPVYDAGTRLFGLEPPRE